MAEGEAMTRMKQIDEIIDDACLSHGPAVPEDEKGGFVHIHLESFAEADKLVNLLCTREEPRGGSP